MHTQVKALTINVFRSSVREKHYYLCSQTLGNSFATGAWEIAGRCNAAAILTSQPQVAANT